MVLAPRDHPTTAEEVSSLQEELKEEYRNKVLDITLEHFIEQTLSVCPEEYRKAFVEFEGRYLGY